MAKRKTTAEFVAEARKVHGQKYDYSSVRYVRTGDKVKIRCKQHGEFAQAALSHVQGQGCAKCANARSGSSQRLTSSEFVRRAKDIHGDEFDYRRVKYSNSKEKVEIICKIHGSFWQQPTKHLSGQKCGNCKGLNITRIRTRTVQEFMGQARERHGNTYSYRLHSYAGWREKMDIRCAVHGWFTQSPTDHLRTQGCARCSRARLGQYSLRKARAGAYKGKHGILYIVKMSSTEEQFYKVGVTARANKIHRMWRLGRHYDIEVLDESASKLSEIVEAEDRILNDYASWRYKPRKRFGGYTECFSVKPEIHQYIQ